MTRDEFLAKFEPKLSASIEEYKSDKQTRLYDMLSYTLLASAKRIRPYLVYLGATFVKGGELTRDELDLIIEFGISVEFIHNYSLVHDDLPAMDNDDIRRGKPTVHKAFSEWEAILVGDELLNLAYERILDMCAGGNADLAKAGAYIARQAGGKGMIKGQLLDLGGIENINQLVETELYKTAYLFRGSLIAGAMLLGSDKKIISALDEYALNLGLAFQIADDILDTDGTDSTVMRFIDETRAREMIIELTNKSVNSLGGYDERAFDLNTLAMKLAVRKS